MPDSSGPFSPRGMSDPEALPAKAAAFWIPALLLVSAGLRVAAAQVPSLGYDGLLSATFASQPASALGWPPEIPDPHPPLYYLQLHYWLVPSQGDTWIVLNSVAWSVASVLSLFWVGLRTQGTRVAATSALLLAVSPFSLAWAQQARMYSMLTFFLIWAWYLHHRFLAEREPGWRWLVPGVVAELCVVYAHVAGFFMLLCVYVYAALRILETRPPRPVLIRWGLGRVCVGLASLPVLSLALDARAQRLAGNFSYALAPDLADLLRSYSVLLLGPRPGEGWPLLVAGLALGLLLALGLRQRTARPLVLSFLVAPVVVGALVSHLSAPIWHERLIGFSLPFLALAGALLVWQGRLARVAMPLGAGSAALALVALLAAGEAALSLRQVARTAHQVDFRRVVERVRERTDPGDVVSVPHVLDYFVWSWYDLGPARDREMLPRKVRLDDGVPVGPGVPPSQLRGRRVWLVRARWHVAPELPYHRRTSTTEYPGFVVDEMDPKSRHEWRAEQGAID